jgi:hypothetical protein
VGSCLRLCCACCYFSAAHLLLLLLLLLQWLFIVEGVPSVAAGLAMLAWLPSHPLTAAMLTRQEAEALHAQVGFMSASCDHTGQHSGGCDTYHDVLYNASVLLVEI